MNDNARRQDGTASVIRMNTTQPQAPDPEAIRASGAWLEAAKSISDPDSLLIAGSVYLGGKVIDRLADVRIARIQAGNSSPAAGGDAGE